MSENDLNIIINISNNMVMFEDKVKRIYIKDVSSLTFHKRNLEKGKSEF